MTMQMARREYLGLSPGGRPGNWDRHIAQIARSYTDKAMECFVRCLEADDAPWAAKISAAREIVDRGWGKAQQTIEVHSTHEATLRLEAIDPSKLAGVEGALLTALASPSTTSPAALASIIDAQAIDLAGESDGEGTSG